jgi:hypothetical protein
MWATEGAQTEQVSFRIVETCISENFSMVELVFEASRTIKAQEFATWIPQVSEITEIAWFSEEEVANLDGILERHRSLLVRLLRRP